MQPVAIQSRMIRAIFFDPEDGRLMLRMANGEERRFTGVSAKAVTDLVRAPSPGRHYIQAFRREHQRAA